MESRSGKEASFPFPASREQTLLVGHQYGARELSVLALTTS